MKRRPRIDQTFNMSSQVITQMHYIQYLTPDEEIKFRQMSPLSYVVPQRLADGDSHRT